ncbi:MAG: uroporphyrinogen-III synthase [Gemmatimonadales bacterium]
MSSMVVVTSSADALLGLPEALRAIPLTVAECPLLSFTAPADWTPLDLALDRWSTYGAVAFTSPRSAAAVASRLRPRGMSWTGGGSTPVVWASGRATAAALGGPPAAVRTPGESETARWGAAGALSRAMMEAGVVSPVLFPCGESRREELPERLRSAGLRVDEVVCYRTLLASDAAARSAAAQATVLVVSSPRVATLLARACPPEARPDLVAVGPTTAASARDSGWTPAAVASLPSVEAVVAAVRSVASRHSSGD